MPFRATLEETLVANLLLHVIDLSNPQFEEHMQTTLEVLNELGAEDKEILTVFNKIDLLESDNLENLKLSQNCKDRRCCICKLRIRRRYRRAITDHRKKTWTYEKGKNFPIPHDQYHLVVKTRKEGVWQMKKPRIVVLESQHSRVIAYWTK